MTHTQDIEYYFKLGQTDYVKGFNEPFGGIASYLGLNTDKEAEINEAYRKGWEKAKKQNISHFHNVIVM